jgi:hypothetical protein
MYGTRTVPPQNLAYQKCNRVSRSKAFMWIKGEIFAVLDPESPVKIIFKIYPNLYPKD